MNAGATPKHRKSVRLSNSAPKRDVAFSSRASRPSSPSIAPATTIATAAAPNRPSSAKRIDGQPGAQPDHRQQVGDEAVERLAPEARPRARPQRAAAA